MAVLLRAALSTKSKDAYREVYCWQTVNCIELWARVLAAAAVRAEQGRGGAGVNDLAALSYPVAQLALGVAGLVPTPSYFPLRLRCVRALCALSSASGAFVPVAPLLLEILAWPELSRPAGRAGNSGFDPALVLRAPKTLLRDAAFQEEIVAQTLELLTQHLAQWACHVSFPELAHLTTVALRRFVKHCPVDRFR